MIPIGTEVRVLEAPPWTGRVGVVIGAYQPHTFHVWFQPGVHSWFSRKELEVMCST